MSKNSVVIYHDSCTDGFCAAWLLHRFFRKIGEENNVEYMPYQYGNLFDITACEDKIVYMADVSLPLVEMKRLATVAKRMLWFDHHETAKAFSYELHSFVHDSLPTKINLGIMFSLDSSGAMLVYDYLSAVEMQDFTEHLQLVKYVQDRDLWKFELQHSKFVNNFIGLTPHTFADYDILSKILSTKEGITAIAAEGATIERVKQTQIENLLKYRRKIAIGDIVVEACNCPVSMLTSELGNALAQLAESGVGCVYFQLQNGDWIYSLRGTGKVKVNDLAKFHGGGGHPNAAGFRSPILMV